MRRKEGRKEEREEGREERWKERRKGGRDPFLRPWTEADHFLLRNCLSPHLDHFPYQLSYLRATTHLL